MLSEHVDKCTGKCKTASVSVKDATRAELIALCQASNAFRSAKEQLAAPSKHGVSTDSAYPQLALNGLAAGYVAANGARVGNNQRVEYRQVSGLGFFKFSAHDRSYRCSPSSHR